MADASADVEKSLKELVKNHLEKELTSGTFECELPLPNTQGHGVSVRLYAPLENVCDLYALHTVGLCSHSLKCPNEVVEDLGGRAEDYARMEILLLLPPGRWRRKRFDVVLHYINAFATKVAKKDGWIWQHHVLKRFHPFDIKKSTMLVESNLAEYNSGSTKVTFFYLVPLTQEQTVAWRAVGSEKVLDAIRKAGQGV